MPNANLSDLGICDTSTGPEQVLTRSKMSDLGICDDDEYDVVESVPEVHSKNELLTELEMLKKKNSELEVSAKVQGLIRNSDNSRYFYINLSKYVIMTHK